MSLIYEDFQSPMASLKVENEKLADKVKKLEMENKKLKAPKRNTKEEDK